MPVTVEQAARQIYDAIKARGKFNIGNALDSVIGVGMNNSADLQVYLNDLLKKKGVLSGQDEAVLNELLAQQEAEKKRRQQIRVKNAIVIVAIALAFGGIIYFLVTKK